MIRAGLIGCGYIAEKHIKTLARFKNVSLSAVCDIDHDKMLEAKRLYQQETGIDTSIQMVSNFIDILNMSEIDVVIVTTVSGLHADITKKAIRHGKHVIVEKPLALSIKEANDIIHLSQAYKKKVLVCHQLRYRRLIRELKGLIEEGYLGNIYYGAASLRLNRSIDYYQSSSWKGTWIKDGGMLVNQGIHLVDILVWLLGNIDSVYGEIATKIKNKETEDIAIGTISFKNRAKGLIEANTITQPSNLGYYLSIFGQKGTICIGGKNFNEIIHCHIDGYPEIEERLVKVSSCQEDEHYDMYQDFIKAIINNGETMLNAREGKKALETIFALYQSSKDKLPINIPLERFSTTDMIE